MSNVLLATERLIGAHVSTAGGLLKALERAEQLHCSCIQIFAGNPRGWQGSSVSEADAQAYRTAAPGYGIREIIIHAIYLVNLASPKSEVVAKSLEAVRRDLISAQRLGARALVLHPGSDLGDGQGEKRLTTALQTLLPECPATCRILLEGMAGTQNSVGDLITLGRIIRRLGKKTGVCLDSAHLCAAGYALETEDGFRQFTQDLEKYIGYQSVGCIHLNDSRQPCGSHRDQHENLGEGFVGAAGLRRLVQHEPFCPMPFVIETPGFDEQGPDQKNMQRLRRYLRSSGKK